MFNRLNILFIIFIKASVSLMSFASRRKNRAPTSRSKRVPDLFSWFADEKYRISKCKTAQPPRAHCSAATAILITQKMDGTCPEPMRQEIECKKTCLNRLPRHKLENYRNCRGDEGHRRQAHCKAVPATGQESGEDINSLES